MHLFLGITGLMTFNDVGDRLFDFSVWDFNPNKGEIYLTMWICQKDHCLLFFVEKFVIAGHYDAISNVYKETALVHWPNRLPPLDVPKCGFDESKCLKNSKF